MNLSENSDLLLHIIVPVYNEGNNFARVHAEIKARVRTPHRIFMVYDMEEDTTVPVARELQKSDPALSLARNTYGRGVLNAIRYGFDQVESGPCLVVMGDLSDDLSTVDLMVEKYREGYKVVCGSRYMEGGRQEGGPPLKRFLSRMAGITLSRLFGFPVQDATNNFRLYDKALLDEVGIESQGGFELAMEITVKAVRKGYPVCEVPTVWKDRTEGESRFKLMKWLPHYLRWYFYAIRPGSGPVASGPKAPLRYAPLLFQVCLGLHLASSLVGWHRNIDGYHGFRQAQTAISAYYTVKDGFSLKYETPVLGKPWSIPMEFPLFPWIVAAAVKAFHTPLDQTGRFFSLLFFYLSLFPCYFLLKYLAPDKNKRLVILCLIVLSPTYLYWSKAFLIESFSLFLCLAYVAATAKALETGRKVYFLPALVFACLAGPVKITTFVVFCLPCAFLLLWFWLQEKGRRLQPQVLLKYFIAGTVSFLLPLLFTLAWTDFADAQKNLNPLAVDFITSRSDIQRQWNFGTWDQKFSPLTWRQYCHNSHLLNTLGFLDIGEVGVPVLLLFLLPAFFFLRGGKIAQILVLACFVEPLAIFTNVFYVHDYYFYENVLFLYVFLGLLLLSLLDLIQRKTQKDLTLLLIPLFLGLSYSEYLSHYNVVWKTPTDGLSSLVRDHTKENDVVLLNGFDWDPTIPYYSQRRALMDKFDRRLADPKMKRALELLGDDKIRAMLVRGELTADMIQERVAAFNFNPKPITWGPYSLYLTNDNPTAPK